MGGMVDTNVLLYAANRDAEEHDRAVAFLTSAGRSADQWYLTEGILYEFLRVATHPKVLASPIDWKQGLEFIEALLEGIRFEIVAAGARHWSLLREVLADLTHPAGNLFFDVRTTVLMREHGIRTIYTTDTDFLQLSGIRVVNPLRADDSA